MIDLIYRIIYWMAAMENKILSINDSGGYYFNDKELHFIVIGALGLLMIFIVYPLFKILAKHDHIMVVAWIYVFTMLIVITFGIEIGQWLTGTGQMEMADVTSGLAGFLVMFFIFAILRGLVRAVAKLLGFGKEEEDARH